MCELVCVVRIVDVWLLYVMCCVVCVLRVVCYIVVRVVYCVVGRLLRVGCGFSFALLCCLVGVGC